MKAITAKLVDVMNDCGYVQKLGKNDFHKYKYATAADVLEKVNAALVKNKLVSYAVPELLSFIDVTNQKGNIEHLATVKMTVTIIDSESGESLQVIGLGSGQDSGDKAIMKAQTAALKYAWMLTLNISTGDDPEADSTVDERMNKPVKQDTKKATKQQIGSLNRLSRLLMTEKTFINGLINRYNVDNVNLLEYSQAEELINILAEMEKNAKIEGQETKATE